MYDYVLLKYLLKSVNEMYVIAKFKLIYLVWMFGILYNVCAWVLVKMCVNVEILCL